MKCETCQALLVSFVSGELSGSTRASANTHIAMCTRCQDDVQKLREGLDAAALLPLLTPPASVRAHVLEAAARVNALPSSGDVGKKRASGPSWWWRVLSRFGELATSPQVAMATVLLLMIAVGAYYLPTSEEAPTAALSPLDPDALEADRSEEAPTATATALPGSTEAEEETEEAEEGAAPQEPAAADEPPPARERRARARTTRGASKGAAERASDGREAKKQKRSQTPMERKAEAYADDAPATRSKRRAAPVPFPAQGNRADTEAAPAARDESVLGAAPPAGSAAVAPERPGAGAAAAEQADPLARAKAAFEARNYAEAARLAEQALKTQGADAAMARWIAARSYRAAGDCRRAMPHYATLRGTTRRFPRAWIEGAQCLLKLGDTTAANSWLSEAEQMPAVSAEARRIRARLDDTAQ